MQISDFINEKTIFFLNENYKTEILDALVLKAVNLGYLDNEDSFRDAIEEREVLLSTGIGSGIAIPHARMSSLKEFFIITAILNSPAGWDAIDQKPVEIVFLIGVPENEHQTYLQILAKLIAIVKNSEKKTAILKAETVEEAGRVFDFAGLDV